MQLKIKFIEDETGQKQLLFPMTPSENQELLEELKKECSWSGISESERRDLEKAIQDEKERPISTSIYAK